MYYNSWKEAISYKKVTKIENFLDNNVTFLLCFLFHIFIPFGPWGCDSTRDSGHACKTGASKGEAAAGGIWGHFFRILWLKYFLDKISWELWIKHFYFMMFLLLTSNAHVNILCTMQIQNTVVWHFVKQNCSCNVIESEKLIPKSTSTSMSNFDMRGERTCAFVFHLLYRY